MAGDEQICAVLAGGQRSKAKRMVMVRGDANRKSLMEELDDGAPTKEVKIWSCQLMFVRAFLRRMGATSYAVSLMFSPSTVLMQDIYEDVLGLCQSSA